MVSAALSTVSSIFGLLGFTGVLIGVYYFYKYLKKDAAEKDLGRVCCDKEKMGYFAVKEPSLMKFWRFWKKVEVPVVPKISALIEAGDDLVYSSALFDSIPANYDEVCWRGIYEGFFDELAWMDNSDYLADTSFSKLHEYAKVGNNHVQDLRKEITELDREIFHEQEQLAWCFSPVYIRDLVSQAFNRVKLGGQDTINRYAKLSDLEKQALKKPHRDRHVLYETTYESGPYLVNCVRQLNTKGSDLQDKAGKVWIYNKKPCIDTSIGEATALSLVLGMRLRDHQDKRIITGYGAFGMSLSCEHIGPFGRLHIAYSNDFGDILEKPMGSGYSILYAKHLACGALPLGQEDDSSGGRRTVSLFIDDTIRAAIWKGKSLSFTHHSHREEKAIDTLRRLPSSTFTAVYNREQKKLEERPLGTITIKSKGVPNFTVQWWEAIAGIVFGGLVPQTTWEVANIVRFTVCGGKPIWDDFGKFARNLQKLIRVVHTKAQNAHSVAGSDRKQGSESDKTQHFQELHLFGRYKLRGKQRHSKEKCNSMSYSGGYENTSVLDVRTASRVFSVYMTLLECIAAQYQRSYGEKSEQYQESRKRAHQAKQEFSWSTVDDIHRACSIELGFAYRYATHNLVPEPEVTTANEDLSDGDTSESENESPAPLPSKRKSLRLYNSKKAGTKAEKIDIMKPYSKAKDCSLEQQQADIFNVCNRYHTHYPSVAHGSNLSLEIKQLKASIKADESGMDFCPYRCGQIARLILVAWTHQVQILEWDEEEEKLTTKGKETRHHKEKRSYKEQTERVNEKLKFDEKKSWLKYRKLGVDYSVMPSVDNFPDISALGGA